MEEDTFNNFSEVWFSLASSSFFYQMLPKKYGLFLVLNYIDFHLDKNTGERRLGLTYSRYIYFSNLWFKIAVLCSKKKKNTTQKERRTKDVLKWWLKGEIGF